MRALVLKSLNKNLELCEVELTSLARGQVLVKVIVSGFCGSQLREIKGERGNAKFLPHLLGHEGCGIVEAVGKGVTTVKTGDKVVMHWRKSTGIESDFPQYILDNALISSGKVTTLSEYSIVSENRLTAIPSEIPSDFAALLGCCLTTAFGVIQHEAKLSTGETIAIFGCGGVGLATIWGASMAGARAIVCLDNLQSTSKMAFDLGATNFINSAQDSIPDEISSLGYETGFDVIVDTTGDTELISLATSLLSENGRLILVAQPNTEIFIPAKSKIFSGSSKQVIFTQGGNTNPDIDIPRYIKLLKNTDNKYKKLIGHRVELDTLNEVIFNRSNSDPGRVLVEIHNE